MARGGFFSVDSLTSVHVVVVDDDPSFRATLVSILRYCGALVTAVGTPDEAITAMGQIKPDVVVITLGGPGTASLPGRIRARKPEDGGNLPIVAVLRAGADDGIPEGCNVRLYEPLNPWELCREVSSLVSTG
jgi:CheY-like chemotaxis protein